jgi:drug/metabolite transporter (DMT)-like permease
MGILFGLLAAGGWGIGDYLSRKASEATRYYSVLFYVQGFYTLLLVLGLGAAALLGAAIVPPNGTPATLPGAVGLAALNLVGSLLLFRAFLIGTLAVVAPIAAAASGFTMLLSLAWGDPITPPRFLALVIILIGVILSSAPDVDDRVAGRRLGVGVPEALGAALVHGVQLWVVQFVVPSWGPYWTAAIMSGATWVLLLAILAGRQRVALRPPAGPMLARLAAMGVCYLAADVGYNLGLGSDSAGVVAVVGSLASPVTVLLAALLLRDRLTVRQWAGVVLIFAGLPLLAWPT